MGGNLTPYIEHIQQSGITLRTYTLSRRSRLLCVSTKCQRNRRDFRFQNGHGQIMQKLNRGHIWLNSRISYCEEA